MSAILRVAVILVFAQGCQSESKAPQKQAGAEPVTANKTAEATVDDSAGSPLARDLDKICNAEEKSGALQQEEGARAVFVAQWLGTQIESEQGRNLLAELSKADPTAKVALLRKRASELGLPGCPLAEAWAGAGESRAE